jgi:dipeptidase D
MAFHMRIGSLEGGSLRNAIPRESVCFLNIDKRQGNSFLEAVTAVAEEIKQELTLVEPDLNIQITGVKASRKVMGLGAQGKLIKAVYAAVNGVYVMSVAIPNLVETSNNIAKIEVKDGEITIGCLTRSSVETGKMDLAHALKSVFDLAGFEVVFSGSYPGWHPNPNSKILKVAKGLYQDLFKEEARVVACHAGLECGILGQNYPEMDMISFGPTIIGPHSPDERVSISSVQKFWKFLTELLKQTP